MFNVGTFEIQYLRKHSLQNLLLGKDRNGSRFEGILDKMPSYEWNDLAVEAAVFLNSIGWLGQASILGANYSNTTSVALCNQERHN